MKPTAVALTLLAGIAALALVIESDSQSSGAVLERISRSGEIIIGYRSDEYPLSFESSAGLPSGYSIEFCRQVSEALQSHLNKPHLQTRFVRITHGNHVAALREGKIDLDCSTMIGPISGVQDIDYSLPTYAAGGSVLTLRQSGIKSIRDLDSRKVGVVRDAPTAPALRNRLRRDKISAEVVWVATNREAVHDLDNGHIDAVVSDQLTLIDRVRQSTSPRNYVLVDQGLASQRYGLAVPENNPELLAIANRTIRDMTRRGETRMLYNLWIARTGLQPADSGSAMAQ